MSNNKKHGAVMVVGGGIGGMQASLDLAEAGYKVYLLEKTPCIGGTMAQLDKTFPTNDCAMCTLAPRIVDAGSHLNIDKITNADLEKVEGEPGNFRVTINKRARYIDLSKCTGCSVCADKCPVKIDSEFDVDLIKRTAIYRRYPQAVPGAFAIDKQGVSPCRLACPAGVNAHAYVVLIAQGRYAEALEVERRQNPFPSICGRICPHPCEVECARNELDEPISIAALKRFLTDWELANPDKKPQIPRTAGIAFGDARQIKKRDEKVAIIGAGPAGLMTARELALKGYQVAIFESQPDAGGMLRYGIPAYRLPKDILKQEIQSAVTDLGVEIKTNTALGKNFTLDDLKKQGYKAIMLAIGAWQGLKLDIPGEQEYSGVIDAVKFLTDLSARGGPCFAGALRRGESAFGGTPPCNAHEVKGKKVAVIGGGNAAMDAARSAWRLGASAVNILYRRSRKEMPANPWEIEAAIEEGIRITYLTAPTRVLGQNGAVMGLECVKMELGEPDASGRRRPVPLKGSEFTIVADIIIPAISQQPDTTSLSDQSIKINRWGLLEVDSITLETSVPGIFCGGDAVSGPATAIEAIEAGRRAAESIDRYLAGQDLSAGGGSASGGKAGREEPLRDRVKKATEGVKKKMRVKMPTLPVEQRKDSFREVELGYTEEQAKTEASRCLSCAVCCECLYCVVACEAKAINHDMPAEEKQTLDVGALILAPGFELFDSNLKQEFGFGRYPNVVSSLQFERILSASGPYQGQILRPSDVAPPHKVASMSRMFSDWFPEYKPKISPPHKIAFIQCVGSREVSSSGGPRFAIALRSGEHNYCSSVCCMYATKEAIIAREHQPDLECHIFYIDIRAFGKGFEAYYERAKELGVKYTRCRPSAVKEVPQTKNLEVVYYDEDNKQQVEEFGMVVLSAGLTPPEGVKQLARICNVELNKNNFCKTGKFTPVETSRPGIYACGPFVEPKDIPETVMEASGAASKAMALLTESRGTLVTRREYPPEKEVTGQEPRVGVFVCHCGKNIGGVADVPSIRDYARTLPDVVYAEDNLYTCSSDTQKKIKAMIKEHNLNRVVVASCTPRTHESLFRNTCREAGLNPYLFEMANIRDQNTWVHMSEPKKATRKAKDLVRMAVAKARLLEPLQNRFLKVEHDALVIGGGLSGMIAALELANQGFTTHLVERTGELGGNMKHLKYLLEEGYHPYHELNRLIDKVTTHPTIKVYTATEVRQVEGSMGNFKTTLKTPVSHPVTLTPTESQGKGLNTAGDSSGAVGAIRMTEVGIEQPPDGETVIKHGVVIVATGAEEYKPKSSTGGSAGGGEYLYGQDSMVITQVKFEEQIARQFASGCAQGDKQKEMAAVSPPSGEASPIRANNPDLDKVNSVVMIQCVGSRNKEHPYCSRICCSFAIKNALKFKRFKPEASVYVLYRDIRTYGFREEYYRKAREAGVVFIRYEDTKNPEVARNNGSPRSSASGAGKLRVSLEDPILKQKVAIDTDLVVLSAGTIPITANEDLAKKLKVPLNQDKFFMEAHMKLRPVDFATDGIYLCGLAHSPKLVEESIAQACAAAARAATIIAKNKVELDAVVSMVLDDKCDGCAYCVDPCAYHALTLIEYARDGAIKKTIDRDLALCKGCGVCQATCPKGAIPINNFKLEQLIAMVNAALEPPVA